MRRYMTGTPGGPYPDMGVCTVPAVWFNALIMVCAPVAIPICPMAPTPAHTHRSDACGGPLMVVAPVQVAQSNTTGP
jgi:hypothetical protein